MSGPVYCILAGGTVHCVPVTAFSSTNEETPKELSHSPQINPLPDRAQLPILRSPVNLAIKRKNLLYTLNNPSLSDLESDVSRRLSNDGSRPNSKVKNGHSDMPPVHVSNKLSRPKPGIMNLDAEQVSDSDDEAADLTLAVLQNYSTHAVYLPQFSVDLKGNLDSDYSQIKTLLSKVFPSWSAPIKVKQLTGGITNMLLSCSHEATNETLLIRVYGQGTNLIIDRNREFVSHLMLNSLDLAPSIHARFENGLIYGFLPGRSLDPNELANKYVYPLIAQQLGNWHNSINCEYIEDGVSTLRKYTASLKKSAESSLLPKSKEGKAAKVPKSINNIWDLIEEWIRIVPQIEALASVFGENTENTHVTTENVREVVQQEFEWLKKALKHATRSPIVVSHCDLLSGNIIVPDSKEFAKRCAEGDAELPPLSENPIQFIDYEYMLPAPRAFDIANHFAEWQGFDCNRSAIPDPSPLNPVMVKWCKGYLNNLKALKDEVGALIHEIACYYGMPGFYWGIWAIIQSELSTIDFNYAEYGKSRLEEYWLWKKKFEYLIL
ncbi:kinase-like protein [Metschnikowia bicuspidata var. bicuspidata NRRL YB-4993]|uniref:ethanolamine kinase n=1 Tax=Metschnikowia bicuspidata var. bicuspidata NRRL YB-4993 TaxID=869754 RepID=A0A1A0HAT7_9ASCO|nr:kinase-like protein [Metschnikowia bicuspidata var. bicuspidata NRRL YB-4993]OBA21234.1 kinase-like protein [Metschnikowia bicuspidata var. bicuspidata NRRL YB-4993]